MTNDTQTLTLTDFLLARIAEDEHDAHLHAGAPPMAALGGSPVIWWQRLAGRVLAECAAKRRIVDLVGAGDIDPMLSEDYDGGYASCWEDVLRLLAAPYAEHPDYDEAWRP